MINWALKNKEKEKWDKLLGTARFGWKPFSNWILEIFFIIGLRYCTQSRGCTFTRYSKCTCTENVILISSKAFFGTTVGHKVKPLSLSRFLCCSASYLSILSFNVCLSLYVHSHQSRLKKILLSFFSKMRQLSDLKSIFP